VNTWCSWVRKGFCYLGWLEMLIDNARLCDCFEVSLVVVRFKIGAFGTYAGFTSWVSEVRYWFCYSEGDGFW